MMQDAFGEDDDRGHSSKKKHHSKDKDRDKDREKGKKQKMIELMEKAENDGVELPPAGSDDVSQDQIESMLAATMKQIETRKKQVQEVVRKEIVTYSGLFSRDFNFHVLTKLLL